MKMICDGKVVTIGDLWNAIERHLLPTDPIPTDAQLAYALDEGDTFVWSSVGDARGVFYVANPQAAPIRVEPDGAARVLVFDAELS